MVVSSSSATSARGGMAAVHREQRGQRGTATSTSQAGTTFPSRQNFYFLERGTPTRISSSGISSRPNDPAYSTAGAFLREGGAPRDAPMPELCRNRRQLRTAWDNRPEA